MSLRSAAFVVAAVLALQVPAFADQAQDRQIGQQVYNDMLGKNLIVTQSPYYGVLQATGKRLSDAAQPHWYTMNFIIIKGNAPNAFSAPGGNVYVTDGLLRTADNEDELAAVLGHETAHLVLGHVVARQHTQKTINTVSNFMQKLVHNQGSQNTSQAATIVGNYGFLNFTRSQEYAADQDGVALAAKAGYNPWGTLWFFKEVEQLYGDAGFEQYVQQHPSTKDRIARVDSYIKGNPKKFGHASAAMKATAGLPESDSGNTLTLH